MSKMSKRFIQTILLCSNIGPSVPGNTFSKIIYPGRVIVPNRCIIQTKTVNKNGDRKDVLGQTTVILQDGLDIQELPAIVKRVKDVNLLENHSFHADESVNKASDKCDSLSKEEKELIAGFKRCHTAKGIYLLLDTIPKSEVSAPIALYALKKIVELENNQHYRNKLVRSGETTSKNFTRTAIMNQLVDTIYSSPNSEIVLEGLKVIGREMISENTSLYRDKLYNEVLLRTVDNKFNIIQVCEIIKVITLLSDVHQPCEDIDKMWVGIVNNENEIDDQNIIEVFRVVPFLKKSRKMVLKILKKRVLDVWWKLPGKTVSEIVSILCEIKYFSFDIFHVLSRWLNTHIHEVLEEDVLEIVCGFLVADYYDNNVEKSLERYVKAKGLKISNPEIISEIMNYCYHFRIYNEDILHSCAEYFIKYAHDLSPSLVKSIFVPYGYLYYYPVNGIKFWTVLEEVLEKKFVQFHPEDVISTALACVYLGKYPVNFVSKIFNPYFLDRLQANQDLKSVKCLRSKLKLFDTAMTLECPFYQGPMLPKDLSAKTILSDGRIQRMANYITDCLSDLVGGYNCISKTVIFPQFPVNELYVVDLLAHPFGLSGSMMRYNLKKDNDAYTAILIHLPEHYCMNSHNLVGPQIMRHRHFRLFGLKVVSLNYTTLSKLSLHQRTLEDYLSERLKLAELPIQSK